MSERPIIGSFLSIGGAIILLFTGALYVSNPIILVGSIVSGLLNLAFGVLLYRKPSRHSLWSTTIIAVSIFDALGVVYYLYAPSVGALMFTAIAEVAPLVCLIGGLAGLLWKSPLKVPTMGSKPPG